MLMVVIGAGASFDSSSDKPPTSHFEKRPPLAKDLFHECFVKYRGDLPLTGILPELVPKPNRSIEEVLQRIQVQAAANPVRKQQLAAVRYYLTDLLSQIPDQWVTFIGGSTNFNALVDQIQNGRKHSGKTAAEPVCFVTFNYDTLLEKALIQELGMRFDAIPDYVRHPEFKVFKLHGSVNWGRALTSAPYGTKSHRGDIIRAVDKLGISDQFFTLGGWSGPMPLYPAIAIPVTEKGTFECPRDHVSMLTTLIPRVTKLLAVGWRGTENHFLELLRNQGPIATVAVAGSEPEAGATINQLRSKGVSITQEVSLAGFSDTMGDGKLYDFFAR